MTAARKEWAEKLRKKEEEINQVRAQVGKNSHKLPRAVQGTGGIPGRGRPALAKTEADAAYQASLLKSRVDAEALRQKKGLPGGRAARDPDPLRRAQPVATAAERRSNSPGSRPWRRRMPGGRMPSDGRAWRDERPTSRRGEPRRDPTRRSVSGCHRGRPRSGRATRVASRTLTHTSGDCWSVSGIPS